MQSSRRKSSSSVEADAKQVRLPLAAQRPGRKEAWPGPAPAWPAGSPLISRDGPLPPGVGSLGLLPASPAVPGAALTHRLPMLTLDSPQLNWQLPEGRDFSHLNPEPVSGKSRAWSPQGQQEVELSLALHTEVHCTSAPGPELLPVAPGK